MSSRFRATSSPKSPNASSASAWWSANGHRRFRSKRDGRLHGRVRADATEVLVQKRYESKNIPIEILRSFVTVVETGSYTKAGELLNLSQAAVSAQIARLRRI